MNQSQVNTLLNKFIEDFGNNPDGERVGYDGYVGECLSLVKHWVDAIAGKSVAPSSGNGEGSGYYTVFPHPLSTYFTKESWQPGKSYPAGSLVVNIPTKHIAIFLAAGKATTDVYEQNADSDGSAPHKANRANSRIDGVLVLKISTPATKPTYYGVKAGDNLSEIASKYHTSLAQLIAWNKSKYPSLATNINLIKVGWVLRVK